MQNYYLTSIRTEINYPFSCCIQPYLDAYHCIKKIRVIEELCPGETDSVPQKFKYLIALLALSFPLVNIISRFVIDFFLTHPIPLPETEKTKPKAIFIIGAPGSGKSSLRDSITDRKPGKYVIIDSDEIKKTLPAYKKLIEEKNPQAASLTHDESLHQRTNLLAYALENKKNFIFDGSGAAKEYYAGRINYGKKIGYRIKLIYVETDLNTCIERCQLRSETTGRVVPQKVIEENHSKVTSNFPHFKSLVHVWKHYNNNGSSAILVEQFPQPQSA